MGGCSAGGSCAIKCSFGSVGVNSDIAVVVDENMLNARMVLAAKANLNFAIVLSHAHTYDFCINIILR